MASTPAKCANCGSDIPRRARSCSECGADERTGWRDNDIYDGLDLPEESWDDTESADSALPREMPWYWWLAGVVALLGFLFIVLGLD